MVIGLSRVIGLTMAGPDKFIKISQKFLNILGQDSDGLDLKILRETTIRTTIQRGLNQETGLPLPPYGRYGYDLDGI
jgi:hypothetical protein